MSEKKFLANATKNNIFLKFDRIFMITYPLFFILGLYLFNRYIAHFKINKITTMFFFMVLIFSMIILKARMLGRDIKNIELLIKEDIDQNFSSEANLFRTWQKYKTQYIYIEAIPVAFLLFVPLIIITTGLSFNIVLNNFIAGYALLVVLYIITIGSLRFLSFKNYMQNLIRTYQHISKSAVKINTEELNQMYNLRRILIITSLAGVSFFILCRYILLPDVRLLHILIFVTSFSALLILGLGLSRAYKIFYNTLTQIDDSRSNAISNRRIEEKI